MLKKWYSYFPWKSRFESKNKSPLKEEEEEEDVFCKWRRRGIPMLLDGRKSWMWPVYYVINIM